VDHPHGPAGWGGVSEPTPVRALVLDYGGVLTTPVRESIAAWLAADGIRPESFSAALKEWLSRNAPDGTPVHRLETGEISVEEFERLLAARLVTDDGGAVDPDGMLQRLFGQMRTEPAMVALVREVRALGLATGLLSNSWGNTYPRALLDELFDVVVISSEAGMRKPAPAAFARVLDGLGVPAQAAVFVDDADVHVDAAARLGMHAILHADPSTTRARVAALVPGLHADTPSQGRAS